MLLKEKVVFGIKITVSFNEYLLFNLFMSKKQIRLKNHELQKKTHCEGLEGRGAQKEK
jgi:hypothetical protein